MAASVAGTGSENESWWQRDLFENAAFVLSPAAWRDAPWWHQDQVENIRRLIISTKQAYNIDDDRIYIFGVSDGGAGTYYIGSNFVDPFAGFMTLIGSPGVLFKERYYAEKSPIFPRLKNMVAKPWFIVNGAEDKLHPVDTLEPYFQMFNRNGVDHVAHIQPDMGHELHMELLRDRVMNFVSDTVRSSMPDTIYWQAANPNT